MKDGKQDNDSRNQSRVSSNWQQSPEKEATDSEALVYTAFHNASTIHLSILHIIDAYKAGCKESRHTTLNKNAEQER